MSSPLPLILLLTLAVVAPGCAMPHVMGLGSYYAVTDAATGRVWYADRLDREKRGVVEFRDRDTGAWISLPAATVREISKAQYRAGPPR